MNIFLYRSSYPRKINLGTRLNRARNSFGGESQRTKLIKDYVRNLYKKISENISETPEEFHYDYFKLEGGELYYIGSRKPLTTKGVLKPVGMLADILGKNRLRNLGFDIPRGKVTARQAIMQTKLQKSYPLSLP